MRRDIPAGILIQSQHVVISDSGARKSNLSHQAIERSAAAASAHTLGDFGQNIVRAVDAQPPAQPLRTVPRVEGTDEGCGLNDYRSISDTGHMYLAFRNTSC